jgi:hypothetical protein
MEGNRRYQEVYHLNEDILVLLEKHISIVAQKQTHSSPQKNRADFVSISDDFLAKDLINVKCENTFKHGN